MIADCRKEAVMANYRHIVVGIMIFAVVPLFATTKRWSGGGSDNFYNNTSNWVGGVAPVAGDTIRFDSSAKECSLNVAPASVGKLTFTSDYTGAFKFAARTLSVTGDVDLRTGGTIAGNTGTLRFTGTAAQTFIPNAGEGLYRVTQYGAGGTTISDNPMYLSNALTVTTGTFDLGSGLTHKVQSVTGSVTGNLSFNISTLIVTAGNATFTNLPVTAGSGALCFQDTAGNQTFYPRASVTFPDIVLEMGATRSLTISTYDLIATDVTISSGTLNLSTGRTHTVQNISGSGNLNFNSSTLRTSGTSVNLGSITTLTQGTGTLEFIGGSGTQVFTPKNGATHPSIVVSGADTVRLSTFALITNGYTQTNGILDLNGKNITTVNSGDFSITNGTSGTLANVGGRKITVAGDANFLGQDISYLNFDPATRCTLAVTGALNAKYTTLKNNVASVQTGLARTCADSGGNINWSFIITKEWDGDAGDNYWGTAANWTDDELPGPDDTISFGGNYTGNCSLNVDATVKEVLFTSAYGGPYTGIFVFKTGNTLTVTGNGDFRSGGTFESQGGTLAFTGSSAQTFYPGTGTFPAIVQNGTGGTTISSSNLTAGTLTITSGTFALGIGLTHTVSTVSGAGNLDFGSSILQVTGATADFSSMGTLTEGTGILTFTGTSAQTFTPKNSATLYRIVQNGSGGTAVLTNEFTLSNALTITSGSFDLGTGLAHSVASIAGAVTGTLVFNTSALEVSNGNADFRNLPVTPGTGKLVFTRTGANQTFYPRSGATFPEIEVKMGSIRIVTLSTNALASAGNLTVTSGTINLGTGLAHSVVSVSGAGNLNFNTSTLQVSGTTINFGSIGTLTAGTGTLQFTGASGDQTFTPRPTGIIHPAISHTGASTLKLYTNPLVANSFSQSAGSFDLNGLNVTTVNGGNFTITNGDTASIRDVGGRTITVAGATSIDGQSGNLVNLKGSSAWAIASTGSIVANYVTLKNCTASVAAGTARNSNDSTGNVNWNFMAGKVWDGEGGDNVWSNALNWRNDILPGINDTVTFDDSYTGNCTLNTSATVKSMLFTSGYTGIFVFTAGETLTVTEDADFRLGGAIVTAGGALKFTGASAQTFTPKSGSTFPAIIQDGAGGTTISGYSLLSGELTITSGTLNMGSGFTHTVTNISGAGDINLGASTLQASGATVNFGSMGTLTPGTATLILNGTSPQTLTPKSGGSFYRITQNGSGGTTVSTNALTVTNAFTVSSGVFNLGAGLTHSAYSVVGAVAGTLSFNTSTLQVTDGNGDFRNLPVSAGTGLLKFTRTAGNQTFYPRLGATFPAIDIAMAVTRTTTIATNALVAPTITLTSGTLNLGAGLTHAIGGISGAGNIDFNTGTLQISGTLANFGSVTTLTPGTGTLKFIGGSGAQVFVPKAGGTHPAIVLSGSDTLRLSTNNCSASSFSQTAGTFDPNGLDFATVNSGNYTITNGTATSFADLAGCSLTVAGAASLNGQEGNLLNLKGSSLWWISVTGALIANYAQIKNSNASGGSQGVAYNSADSMGNTNWGFSIPKEWDGGGGDGKWNTAANWTNDELPATDDTVIFNGTSVSNCTLNTTASVAGILFNTSYTGVFVFYGTDTLKVAGNADFTTGGTIQMLGGALEFTGSSPQIFTTKSGATYPDVIQNGSGGTTINGYSLSAQQLNIKSGSFALGTGFTHTIIEFYGSGDINFGSSILQATGATINFGSMGTITSGTGTLIFTGTSSQTFTPKSGGSFYKVTQNGSGGTTVSTNGLTLTNALTVTSGAFNLGTGLTHTIGAGISGAVAGNLSFGSSTLDISAGNGDFRNLPVTAGTGRLAFSNGEANQVCYPRLGAAFPEIEIKMGATRTTTITTNALNTSNIILTSGTLNLGTGFTHTATNVSATSGNLNFNTSTLQVTGASINFSSIGTLTPSTGTLQFDGGSGAQVFTPKSGGTHPAILLSGSDTLRLATNALSANGYSQTAGTLDLNGVNIAIVNSGNFAVSDGTSASFANFAGRKITVAGDANFLGQSLNYIDLKTATNCTLAVTGALNAKYTALKNNVAVGPTGIARSCADSTGNINWSFIQTKEWDGGGADNKWGTAANWTDDALPSATDTISFGGSYVGNCTLNIDATVKAVIFTSAYTGTFVFSSGNTLTITGLGDFRSGGAFTASGGTLAFTGTTAQTFYPGTGTFPAIQQNGSGGTTISTNNLSAGILTITSGSLGLGAGLIHTVTNVLGSGDLDFGSSTLQVSGTTVNLGSFNSVTEGTGTLIFTGSSPQTFTPKSSATMYRITQNGSGGTTVSTNAFILSNAFTITSGTFDLGTGLTHSVVSLSGAVAGNLSFNTSTLQVTDGNADFRNLPVTAGSGTLKFTRIAGNQTFYPRSGATFPAIDISMDAARTTTISTNALIASTLTINSGTCNLGTGFTHTVTGVSGSGNLNFSSSILQVSGTSIDLNSLGTLTPATGTLRFTGTSGTQVFVPRSGQTHPAISHTGSQTLQLSTNSLIANSFSQTAGTLDLNGRNIATVSGGNFSITSGTGSSLANLENRKITIAGNGVFNGQISNYLNLLSTQPCTLNVTGTLNAQYAMIKNSKAIGTAGNAIYSDDSTGNTGWNFQTELDSLMVKTADIMPIYTLAEYATDVPGLRIIIRHPNPSGLTKSIIKLLVSTTPLSDPSAVIDRKALRRKGEASDLYTSGTIETANPMVFDLSASPVYLRPGLSDTLDVRFDIVGSPSSSIKLTLSSEQSVIARDSAANDSVRIAGDGVVFPLASSTGTIDATTNTPSAKTLTANLTEWSATDERLDTRGSEEFYVTWDNDNYYFVWNGRDLSTAGDLFIYMSTTTSGTDTTYNYGSFGRHVLSSGFSGADYLFYYHSGIDYGLLDAAADYSPLTFNGTITLSGNVTEIRVPFSDLGDCDTVRIIPFIQQKTSAEVLSSVPSDYFSIYQRNPTGPAPQTFISWMKVNRTAIGVTPVANAVFDSTSKTKPKWTYNLGEGNYASSISIGDSVMYVAVGGVNPGIVCLDYQGNYRWDYSTASVPSAIAYYFDWNTPSPCYALLVYCVGSDFYAGHDYLSTYTPFYAAQPLGAVGGQPSLSYPPDGTNYDRYAYVPLSNGDVKKIDTQTGGTTWTRSMNASYKSTIATQSTHIYIGCSDGDVHRYDISGGALTSVNTGSDSVNTKVTWGTTLKHLYIAPKNITLFAYDSVLTSTPAWSRNLGAVQEASPYWSSGTRNLYCPTGSQVKNVRDDTTSSSVLWTYTTAGAVTTNPVTAGSAVYFSSADKKHYAVNATTGANANGFPTAVFNGSNASRVAADAFWNNVYFSGDSTVYCYPEQ